MLVLGLPSVGYRNSADIPAVPETGTAADIRVCDRVLTSHSLDTAVVCFAALYSETVGVRVYTAVVHSFETGQAVVCPDLFADTSVDANARFGQCAPYSSQL